MPDFELNMSNSVTWKNLTLLLDLQSMYGLSLSNTTEHLMQNAATRVNSYDDILNAWTPDHQNTMVPALRTAADHGSPSEVADSYAVEDASFLRRSEEHTSELQSLMRISYAVFCLKKKKIEHYIQPTRTITEKEI